MSGFAEGYALIVGVAGYPSLPRLPITVLNDAVDLARTLWDPERCGYPAKQVKLLLDGEATADDIRKGLSWLAGQSSAGDTALFFFSGHGWRNTGGQSPENYLAAYDAYTGRPHPEGLIHGGELTELLASVRAGRLAVFFDACYSAGLAELKGGDKGSPFGFGPGLDENYYHTLYEQLGCGRGRAIIASSRPDETSLVSPKARNSIFTRCLLRGLHGEAAVGGNMISVLDLFKFLSKQVQVESSSRQHPVCKAEVEDDFPVAFCRQSGEPPMPQENRSDPSQSRGEGMKQAGRDLFDVRGNVGKIAIDNR